MSAISIIPRASADPLITPRLVVDGGRRLDLSAEQARGTYKPVDTSTLIDVLAAAGLRGRGGAGFPAHIKWRTVSEAEQCVVVANGEEGEPASFKDRWLLTHRPHAVIDGLLLAAQVLKARRLILYVSDDDAHRCLERALQDLRASGIAPRAQDIELFKVAPTYVAGEESAACRAINGGPALPLAKPPRVFESGVDGLPTLVSNVETLAHAAWIARNGASAYRLYGADASPGTTLITLGGDCTRPGVYEVAYGVRLSDVCHRLAGGMAGGPVKAILAGGWFGGVLPASAIDLPLTFEALRDLQSGFGCGAFTVLTETSDALAVVADIAAWYARETAGQCGVCMKGTQAISGAIADARAGRASETTLVNLRRWGATLHGRGTCSFLDGAAALARSTVENLLEPPVEAR